MRWRSSVMQLSRSGHVWFIVRGLHSISTDIMNTNLVSLIRWVGKLKLQPNINGDIIIIIRIISNVMYDFHISSIDRSKTANCMSISSVRGMVAHHGKIPSITIYIYMCVCRQCGTQPFTPTHFLLTALYAHHTNTAAHLSKLIRSVFALLSFSPSTLSVFI